MTLKAIWDISVIKIKGLIKWLPFVSNIPMPDVVSITSTSRCNLRCVMCHHGIRKIKKEDFSLDLVEGLKSAFSSAGVVTLTGLGEPLLSDNFWWFLENGEEV